MEPIFYQTVEQLSQLLEKKEISSVELTSLFLDRIAAIDPKIKAFLKVDREASLAAAKESDQRRASGKTLSQLDGIPVGIKDIIAEKGQQLTSGSKILENYISPYDATVIEKLRQAGAVLLGRLNLDEFAMGSSTETSAYQKTHNPWNLDYIPGGSSGGSAASVAAGELPLSLGTDTGGSIRQPAACCGICALKTTYGRISRYGLSSLASSTDQIGPFARNTRDLSLILQIIVGHDDRDATSIRQPVPDYYKNISNHQPCRIGIPKEYFGEGIDPEVRQSVEDAIKFYKDNGYEIREVSLPHTRYAVPVYYVIMTAEAASNLARFDGIRYTHRSPKSTNAIDIYFKSRDEGFGAEVKRRILLGTFVLSSDHQGAYYLRAQKVRALIRQDFINAFKEVDVILSPTAPTTAFKLGERMSDPLQMYLSDICTVSASLAGLPAISIPCGFSSKNLPIGLQLMGNYLQEGQLLTVANHFEEAHDYHNRHPEI